MPNHTKKMALTHFDAAGQAHMADVGQQAETHRMARASGVIRMQATTLALIDQGRADKGDVVGIARIAAIQAAKRKADLIPLCPPPAPDTSRGRVPHRARHTVLAMHGPG